MDSEERINVLLGDPRKAIVRMAIPLFLSLLVAQVNVLADRAWCAGLGDDAMSAVAVVIPIYLTIVGLGSGFGVGASAVISRMIGATRKDAAENVAVQALIFSIAFGIVLTPILFFLQTDFLALIGAPNILDLCEQYMLPYSLFTLLIVVNGTIAGILNGQGATHLSTAMMAVQAFSNIILDPIFIYSMGMGLPGAAIATVISTILSIVLGTVMVLSKKTYLSIRRSDFHYNKGNMRLLLVAGVPQMLEYAVMYFMNIVLNCVVLMSAEGSHALTLYSTPDNLMDLLVIPAFAIGSALVPVASSALGQKDIQRMKSSFRFAFILGIACVALLAGIVELIPEQCLYIFSYSGEMLENRPAMVEILKIMCIYVIFFAFTPLSSGYMQALGRPNRSVIMALWRNFVLIMFFLYAVQFSVTAIIWALVFGHMVGAVSIFIVAKITERQVFKKMGKDAVASESSGNA